MRYNLRNERFYSFLKLNLTVFFIGFICINAQPASLNQQPVERKLHNWAPNTKAEIDKLINKNAGQKNLYVVFDWDNTSMYADVQDMLFIYQLENLIFKMTPDEFKYSFMHYADDISKKNLEIPDKNFGTSFCNIDGKPISISLIAGDCFNDYKFFYENYRGINPEAKGNLTLDEIKKTDQFSDFKAKMWFTYAALYELFPSNVAYTWIMYVTIPGFTKEEFRGIVVKAIDWGIERECKKVYFDSPASLKGNSGAVSNSAADNYFCNTVRPTAEVGELFNEFEKNNIQVYICTASFQEIVDVVATNPKYGYSLLQNRVIGMRLRKDAEGRFLSQYDFSENYTINGMGGKTINVNNILVSKFKANPLMIAGDSSGDYYMMTELSGLNGVKMINNYNPVQLVLVVNRLKKGNIGEICRIAVDQLSGKKNNSTIVVLQGRDENSGLWIPTEKTLKLGLSRYDDLQLLP